MRSLLTVLALTLAAAAAHAEQHYDIELILFKYSRNEHFSSENWPKQWPIPDTAEALDLDRISGEYRDRFQTLDNDRRTLDGIVSSLDQSSRYEILAYKAWRQPGLDKDKAVDILIQSGDRYERQRRATLFGDNRTTQGTLFLRPGEIGESLSRLDAGAGQPLTEQYRRVSDNSQVDPADLVYELEGTVKVIRSRFLHIYTDLLLMQPVQLEPVESDASGKHESAGSAVPETASTQQESAPRYRVIPAGDNESFTTLQGIHIDLHRRMRSEEMHHLDHPLLGAIVKATPVD